MKSASVLGDAKAMYQERAPPVGVGEELDLTIESVGAKGDGIAKVNGFVLFVAGTRQGERVKVRVTKVLQKVGFAEVVSKKAQRADVQVEQPQEEAPREETPQYEDTEDFGES